MTDSKETCEMLPCPLCGRQPDYQHFNISQNMRGRIICTCGLGLTQGRNDTEDGTILKWNTRSDHAVQAANERKAEQAIAATVGADYAITFAPTLDRPHETMVGETVFDSEGVAVGWIVNARIEEVTE